MYSSLEACLLDLEKNGHLVRIKQEVDPYLEMAAIHLRVNEAGGSALLFENVKGSRFRAVSNLFGTMERCRFIFRDTLPQVQRLIHLRNNPTDIFNNPVKNAQAGLSAIKALPLRDSFSKPTFQEIQIKDIPQIVHWQKDGGAFLTLPQVYSENIDHPGIKNANIGMYRIQLSGNEYIQDKEVGLHYQIHRGIGIHQQLANTKGQPLKVSIFLGGPPAHTLAAVMPLPEDISETMFAGILAGRRFRYTYEDGYCISSDADFVITGEVYPQDVKPEGPFGDHLGYYSLTHPFPVMRVHKVYARQNAILPFTVVGRPPQEDSCFGALIHEITGDAISKEIPGVKEVHAVDAAGVHPLLLAIGSERYTPYQRVQQPAELLTIANPILGTGQLSLAKYLFIAASSDSQPPSTHHTEQFLAYVLERIDLSRDIHFHTQTTIDTLDYSGSSLNHGSKVVIAACGPVKRILGTEVPVGLKDLKRFINPQLAMRGVVCIQAPLFTTYENAAKDLDELTEQLSGATDMESIPLLVLCEDARFTTANLNNFLWTTFTRSDPARDIYGLESFFRDKHWGCKNTLIIDARIKPHHAPPLEKNEIIEEKIARFFKKGVILG